MSYEVKYNSELGTSVFVVVSVRCDISFSSQVGISGFFYGLQGQETPISQASNSFWVRKTTLKIIVSLKLSIVLSKNNFKQINLNETLGFGLVESPQDVFDALYVMEVPQRDPYIKTNLEIRPWLG